MDYKQTKENTKHTNIRIPIKTYEKIEEIARKQQRNPSQQIRFIIERYFEMTETN